MNGTRQAINFLRYTRDHLAGVSKSKINLSMKMDGAPAIFAGVVPSGEENAGKFFVAKKGLFNKTPKYYTTNQEIDADISSADLANKMKLALKLLPKIGIKGIIQGDFLYSRDTLKTATVNGVKYITFHPNTIVYAVPMNSELARTIRASQIGIVWHTIYTGGKTFDSMKATFNQPIVHKLKPTKSVWFTGVIHKDVSGSATMTEAETAHMSMLFSRAGKIFQSLSPQALNGPKNNKELLMRIKTFNNTKIRDRVEVKNTTAHVEELMQWIYDYYQKKIDDLKSDKAKEKWKENRKDVMSYFSNVPKSEIIKIFDLINVLVEAKMFILQKLNQIKHLNTFLITKKGFIVTGHEGFVVSDHLGRNGMKLVDRLEFSFANFSPEVLKGFDLRS